MVKNHKNKVIELIDKTMNISAKEFPENKQISEISEWDSFHNILLISRIQEEFNIDITIDEVEEIKCLSDLWRIVQKKLD